MYEPMFCPKCKTNLLMVGDFQSLAYKAKERIYEKVFLNCLKSHLNPSEQYDKCGNCYEYYVIDCSNGHGVFCCHNSKCRFLFCTACKKRIMGDNELDFKQHEVCWNSRLNNVYHHGKNTISYLSFLINS